MAYELGRASKAGLYWREKASENNLMAIMLLAVKPSGYIVVPKSCIDGKKYGYSIEVQDREDAVRFKLITTTKQPKAKEESHLSVVPPLSKDEAS